MSHVQARVDSLQHRLRVKSDRNSLDDSKATLPAKPGRSIGSGNYVVTLGLRTPKKDLTLTFDTDSDVTWIKCQPCIRHGPCSHMNEARTSAPTLAEIMSHDQARVNSLQHRLRVKSDRNSLDDSKATLPAKPRRPIGGGNYVVTLGLEPPKRTLPLSSTPAATLPGFSASDA
ncbi:hypothetical protein C3L33_15997, partial [Rhododendron williamsianum]